LLRSQSSSFRRRYGAGQSAGMWTNCASAPPDSCSSKRQEKARAMLASQMAACRIEIAQDLGQKAGRDFTCQSWNRREPVTQTAVQHPFDYRLVGS
jgi:hypothetical protein